MNKAQLIDEVAKVTCSKKEAGLALDATLAAIQKALKKGDSVTLLGFGTFGVSKRKARKWQDPPDRRGHENSRKRRSLYLKPESALKRQLNRLTTHHQIAVSCSGGADLFINQ